MTINPMQQPAQPRLFQVPRAADIMAALAIPEELDEFLNEQDVAQLVVAYLNHCRRPLRVWAAGGQHRVSLLGAELWTVHADGRMTVHHWCSDHDDAWEFRPCPPHQVNMMLFTPDGYRSHPVFRRINRQLVQRHGRVIHEVEEFLDHVRQNLQDVIFTPTYCAALGAQFCDALELDSQALRLAQSLIAETLGMQHARLGHYEHIKRHLAAYLSTEQEAPALLSLLDHLADRLEPGEDPKKGLKRVLMQAGLKPALWRLLHRQPSSRVARVRIDRLLDRLCGSLEPNPCTLLKLLSRVQAIAGHQWPCDVLLSAMVAAFHDRYEDPFASDEDAACRFPWDRLDCALPVLRRLQDWFEQGDVTDSFPADGEVLCEHGLVGPHSWIGIYAPDARFAWTAQWHQDVVEVVTWSDAHPQSWDARRLRQWNFDQFKRRTARGDEAMDAEYRYYARLPEWQTPYTIDLGSKDVRAVILNSALDFLREGRAARNCVGRLWEAAHEGRALFVSLRSVGPDGLDKPTVRPLATLHISLDARVSLREVRGFANNPPSKQMLGLARQCAWQVRRQHWMRHHGTGQQDAYGVDEREAA